MKTNCAKIWFLLAFIIPLSMASVCDANGQEAGKIEPRTDPVDNGMGKSRVEPESMLGGEGSVESKELPAIAVKEESLEKGIRPASHAHMERTQVAYWSLISISSASLIVGGVFGFQAMSEYERYGDNSVNQFRERARSRKIASYSFLGVASSTAVAALIVGIIRHKDHKKGKYTSLTGFGGRGWTPRLGLGAFVWAF